MRQDDDAVPRQMKVRLDGVRADVDGAAKGRHRVLRKRGLVPAVRYSLREPYLRICCPALVGPAGDRQGRKRRGCCQVSDPLLTQYPGIGRVTTDCRGTFVTHLVQHRPSSRAGASTRPVSSSWSWISSALRCSALQLFFFSPVGGGSAPRAVTKSSEFPKEKKKVPLFTFSMSFQECIKNIAKKAKSETPKIPRTIVEKKASKKMLLPLAVITRDTWISVTRKARVPEFATPQRTCWGAMCVCVCLSLSFFRCKLRSPRVTPRPQRIAMGTLVLCVVMDPSMGRY